MSSSCPSCGARLKCSCELRSASNGTRCCTSCIGRVEADIAAKKNQQPKTANAPTNVQAIYQPPRK